MLNSRATFNSKLLIYNYSMSNDFDNSDVIIIGGGLAGLTTAALLARSGKRVTLFERSSKEIGGRARSTEVDGFYFNQGPHALFLTDATDSTLKEIGITFTGGTAGGKGKSYLISDGRKREVPGDYGSWLSSRKGDSTLETDGSRFFKSPTEMDFSQLEGVTVQEWLDKNFHDTNDAEIIKAILRLNTYRNDPEIQSIGSALRQIYVSSRAGGVMYVDGGWQTLVDGLLTAAKNANARIVMDKKAVSVKRTDSSGWQVLLSDKTQVSAKTVVIAAGPMDAYGLFDDNERPEVLSKAAKEAKTLRLVCLDVALSSLPDNDALFA